MEPNSERRSGDGTRVDVGQRREIPYDIFFSGTMLLGEILLNDQWIEEAIHAIGNNTCLKRLVVDLGFRAATRTRKAHRRLADVCQELARNRSIEEFKLSINCYPYVDIYQLLTPFFEFNCNLRSIDVSETHPSEQAFSSLLLALSKCKNKLEHLSITWNSLTNAESAAFFSSCSGMCNLLDLHYCEKTIGIGKSECIALALMLKTSDFKLQSLQLQLGKNCDDECISFLGAGLMNSTSLRSLCVTGNSSVTANGWELFLTALFKSTRSILKLQCLRLEETEIGDEVVAFLGSSLANNRTLKRLDLNCITSITVEGWKEFAARLRNSALEELILFKCTLNDYSAAAIVWALTTNASLKRLHMVRNRAIISSAGLVVIIELLGEHKPALEELYLDGSHRLSRLTVDGWNTLSHAICDKSSIEATYSSNHSFHTLRGSMLLWCPHTIILLLRMNKSIEDKAEVARQKILKYHFSGGKKDIQVFARMPENHMPFAIAWIGRNKLGYSVMFDFVSSFPALFDIRHGPAAGRRVKRKLNAST